ncbi:transcriptional regulator, GntR family [Brucella vulpis]|nr:transcriptional regulator, GntR family [Brucella vulpis]CUW51467.1 transcriptional regulator, GntR family [Brucella vulpis]
MAGEDLIAKDVPALSLHQRILDDIESRILSGEWLPGHRIPFEHELTEYYGCSRMTVNKALTQLAKAGLIERKRRSGSFVSFPQSQAAILEIHDIREEVAALGLPYRFELMNRWERLSGPADARRLDIARHTPLVELLCRHYAGKRVFCTGRAHHQSGGRFRSRRDGFRAEFTGAMARCLCAVEQRQTYHPCHCRDAGSSGQT